MRVIRPEEVKPEEMSAPLFTGKVTRQPVVDQEESESFNCAIITFPRGVRNKLHTHTSDQILIVTAGHGIVATENVEQLVGPGDIIHIPAGERHWHGATEHSAFSHIFLTQSGSRTTQLE